MKIYAIPVAIAAVLLATSCDKHRLLLKERDSVESEIKRRNEELNAIDSHLSALGLDPMAAAVTMDRQHSDWQKLIVKQEQELSALTKKCSDGAEGLKNLQSQIDAYKARYAR